MEWGTYASERAGGLQLEVRGTVDAGLVAPIYGVGTPSGNYRNLHGHFMVNDQAFSCLTALSPLTTGDPSNP